MTPSYTTDFDLRRRGLIALLIGILIIALAGQSAHGAAPKQQEFASPEEATQMLVAALEAGDKRAMLNILGSQAKPLIDSGDPVADRDAWTRFVVAYQQAHALVKTGDAMVLQVGSDEWPFPIPLVERDGRWHFDTEAGQQEILDRRIGRNEISAMQVALAYLDAQREYYLRNPQNAKLAQYAQRVASTPGKHDGLYWPTKDDEAPSPLGPYIARARGEGYKKAGSGAGAPYHGYYYRILTAQGADAPGGAYDYVVRGAMIGGFALVAFPAEYGNSGVMTFVVNHDGVIYEKDLGPDGAKQARAMKLFNPDATWKQVAPQSDAPA
jgi:type II secretory pathway pseudopilin PulG